MKMITETATSVANRAAILSAMKRSMRSAKADGGPARAGPPSEVAF